MIPKRKLLFKANRETIFMEKIIIEGQRELSGTIEINGAKNSAVALLPAAILSDEETIINKIPNITDVSVLKARKFFSIYNVFFTF